MILTIVLISRSIITYLFLIILTHLIKQHKNSNLENLNKLTVLFTIFISTNIIINYKENIIYQIIPIITILILRELAIILYLEHKQVRNYFDKEPIILVRNSKIIFKNLINNNYSINKLLEELRKKNIYSLEEIRYLFLEPNQELSIFFYNEKKYENYKEPIILNSKINKNVLKISNLNEKELKNMLSKERLTLEEIYYALYKNKKLYIIKNSDIK